MYIDLTYMKPITHSFIPFLFNIHHLS